MQTIASEIYQQQIAAFIVSFSQFVSLFVVPQVWTRKCFAQHTDVRSGKALAEPTLRVAWLVKRSI